MKILFAIDPWIYRDSVGNQMYTLKNIFLKAMEGLKEERNEIKLLIGEDMLYSLEKENLKIPFDIIVIPLRDLYKIYPNHYEAHKIQFYKKETEEQKLKTKKIIQNNMKKWEPDIIISFTTPASVWKYVFKDCLSLQFENGVFSRAPYPYLCQLDPFGFLKESYPYKYMNEIKKCGMNTDEKERMLNLKNAYLQNIFDKKNPIKKEKIREYNGQKVILVPLSYNGVIINDAASDFRSQLDLLINIMEKVPANIKVIATRHSLQMNGSIPRETEEFLLEKYKNLSFVYSLEKYAFLSQWLTPLVDCVVSINSTVAYHAALYGKKVIALGDCEINSVANDENLNDIEKILEQTDDNEGAISVLYRLLTRHSFSLKRFHDGRWLNDRLIKMFNNHLNGNLYEEFEGLPLIDNNEDKIFYELINEAPGNSMDYKPRIR